MGKDYSQFKDRGTYMSGNQNVTYGSEVLSEEQASALVNTNQEAANEQPSALESQEQAQENIEEDVSTEVADVQAVETQGNESQCDVPQVTETVEASNEQQVAPTTEAV